MAFFGTTPDRTVRLDRFDDRQAQGLNFLLDRGQQGMQDPYAGFAPIEDRARQQFQESTIPTIMERLGGAGAAMSSPAVAQILGGAGRGLESDLAAQRSQFGQNQIMQMLQSMQLGLTPRFDTQYIPEQAGFMEMLGTGAASALPLLLMNMMQGRGGQQKTGGGGQQQPVGTEGGRAELPKGDPSNWSWSDIASTIASFGKIAAAFI